MKWVKDSTGRFPQRPYYLPNELDAECEHIILSFLQNRHGRVEFPISTDDLTVLIETAVDDLDLYADLSQEEGEVEGVTDFFPGKRPKVRISGALSEAPQLQNRFRTTLTHEFGHVHFHTMMFEIGKQTPSLFPSPNKIQSNKCKRESIVNAGQTDWMEWQAGYSCGAFLMPIGALREATRNFLTQNGLSVGKFAVNSHEGQGLISKVATAFGTSKDAARVRLIQQGVLFEGGVSPGTSLFGSP